jgi:hypothetical protein
MALDIINIFTQTLGVSHEQTIFDDIGHYHASSWLYFK